MNKKEFAKLKKLVHMIHDNAPYVEQCDCIDDDGEPSDEECEYHRALRQLYDVAGEVVKLSEVKV